MLEYVRRLLLAQTRLAAQFDTAPQPEIREVTLQMEKKEQNSPEEDAPGPGETAGAYADGRGDGRDRDVVRRAGVAGDGAADAAAREHAAAKIGARRSWSRRERWRRR